MQFCRLGLFGPEERCLAGSCESGNEPSAFIKCREFLDQLRNS